MTGWEIEVGEGEKVEEKSGDNRREGRGGDVSAQTTSTCVYILITLPCGTSKLIMGVFGTIL